jgi:acetoin utilization deacetylase AcuC-like enzyme
MGAILLSTDERMLAHNPGPGHPERPERLRAILDDLRRRPIDGTRWATPSPATPEALALAHDPGYVSSILSLRGQSTELDPDTIVSPGSIDAALLAAGAAIQTVDALMSRDTDSAVAIVRPPGHHAERARAMGFCLFNNIAIAAAHARACHGLDRILIIDWDVHHGNGTQDIFYSDPAVLYFSTHQFPFYPGTGGAHEVGEGAGRGFTVNVPLPAGIGDSEYAAIFDLVLSPIADAFAPQLVLVSAGFDAHRSDPLGEMRMSERGFAHLCAVAEEIAARHAEGRIALILEGGYNIHNLAADVRACIEVLAGREVEPIAHTDEALAIAYRAREFHARCWPTLNPDS